MKRSKNVLNEIWQLLNLVCAFYLSEKNFFIKKKCVIPNGDFKSHSYFVSLSYFPMYFISLVTHLEVKILLQKGFMGDE